MITLLSPTKTQSNIITDNYLTETKPAEIKKADFLMSALHKLTADQLSTIMKISDSLAINTKKLINEWVKNKERGTQAIHLFQGDAFQKLDAGSLNKDEMAFSQDHLIILSALYGYLRPMDFVSAYRLDLKDALKIPGFRNLYAYWKEAVTRGLNNLLTTQKNNIILNLASGEYADVIDLKKLTARVIHVDFKVQKDNACKTVGIYAKRGRGLLARYMMQNKIDTPDKIIKFNAEGFQFSEKLSTPDNYVFIIKFAV